MMDESKTTARIVGALFLIAMVASLVGGGWLESITGAPDALTRAAGQRAQVVAGVLLELLNCAAVVGIAAGIFPVMRKHDEALAAGYLGARVIEAAVLSLAAIVPLVVVALSHEYGAAGSPADAATFRVAAAVAIAARGHVASLVTPVFISVASTLLYVFLYRSRLVPRFLSVWGALAVAAMLAWNVLEAFGVRVPAGRVLALPMILNEVVLGIWLLMRGFAAPPWPRATRSAP
jgi:hypothetical protein